MKKSHSIRLVLLGSATAALAACDERGTVSESAQFYPTVNECTADNTTQPCEDAKAAADRSLAAETPRFSQKQQCEQQFGVGNCETHQAANGSSFFMPLLMGYMIGNMMNGSRFSQPVYRGPGNTAVMPSGGRLLNVGRFDNLGGASGTRPAFRPTAQAAPVSRGGFGSTARNYNGFGG